MTALVHIVHEGFAFCPIRELYTVPGQWPEDRHRWVRLEQIDEATCASCIQAAALAAAVGAPLPEFEYVVELARLAAELSPCAKSRRGAVVWMRGLGFYGFGFNEPPEGFQCTGTEECRRACADKCVHAEARAIRWAFARVPLGYRTSLTGFDLLHVKIDEDGRIMASGGPSCPRCSAQIADVGISGVWLLHGGWHRYTAEEFHRESLIAKGLIP